MREIRRRLAELKKENDELKILLSISGKNRDEYESKVILATLMINDQFIVFRLDSST